MKSFESFGVVGSCDLDANDVGALIPPLNATLLISFYQVKELISFNAILVRMHVV